MSIEIDYGRRVHGDLMSIGDAPEDFMDRPLEEQVYLAARSHLCPIPDEVVEYYAGVYAESHQDITDATTIREAGMMMAVKRYLECNFVLKHVILNEAERSNPELYEALTTPVERLDGEIPDQRLKAEFLPEGFGEEMQLGSTLYGYALPRILLTQFGENRDNFDKRNQQRITEGIDIVNRLVKEYSDPFEFMVMLGETVIQSDANPERVIYHMLSASLLKEEGCRQAFAKTIALMEESAPNLWSHYQYMIETNGIEGMREKGIVVAEDLVTPIES